MKNFPVSEPEKSNEPITNMSKLDHALAYAARGFPVFPLHSVREGRCSCGKESCKRNQWGKHPRTAHGLKDATTDEAQIRRWWTEWPDANVGIRTGLIDNGEYRGFYLFVLDVDTDERKGKQGATSFARLTDGREPLFAIEAKSGSGGHHHYLLCVKPFASRNSRLVDSSGNMLPGLDIKCKDGYIIAPPSNHESGGTYEWIDDEKFMGIAGYNIPWMPEWLEETVIRSEAQGIEGSKHHAHGFDLPDELERVKSALRVVPAVDRKQWIDVGMAMKHAFGDEGAEPWSEWSRENGGKSWVGEEDCLETWRSLKPVGQIGLGSIFMLARTNGWADPMAPALGMTLEGLQQLEEMNERFYVIGVGKGVAIGSEEWDPGAKRYLQRLMLPGAFNLVHETKVVLVHGKLKPLPEVWRRYRKRRTYERMDLIPKGPVPDGTYNLWRGFSVDPVPGCWDKFKAHILNIICSGNQELFEYVIRWMAWAVQNPDSRPGVALVLRGEQGTGKGAFASGFGRLFGQHFRQLFQTRQVTGNFNAHLRDTILLFVDEGFWAGDKQGEAVLKGMITEDQLPIERKGFDLEFAPNHIHMIMASNKAWVVPAGNHDRRYCVLDVSPQVMQNEGYFDALNKELEDGGRAAMLHDLLAMDLSGFRVRAFPKTAAGLDQKLANAESHMDWLITCCMNGQIDPFEEDWAGGYGLPKRVVYALYCGTNGKNKLSAGQFAAQLHKLLGPYGFRSTKIREPRTRESDDKEVMVRVPYFVFPSLEDCRRAIDQALGQEIPWPADEGDWDGAAHSGDGDWDPELDKV